MEEKIKEYLAKIPFTLVLAAFVAYLGYDVWSFLNSDDSPLVEKIKQTENLRTTSEQMRKKINENKEFIRKLDLKKLELRALAQQLDQMKGTLSESFDIAQFMKMIDSEASRVGFSISSFKPIKSTGFEYYVEHSFEISFKSAFAQLLVFLERLSTAEKIVRVDDFEIQQLSSTLSTVGSVDLAGKLILKAYSYKGSKADEAAQNPGGINDKATPDGGASS